MTIQLYTFLFLFLLNYIFCQNAQAPAQVNLKITIYKVGSNVPLNGTIMLRVCVDKIDKKCYWTFNKEIDVKQIHKTVDYEYAIDNMNVDMKLGLQLDAMKILINFNRKNINLSSIDRSATYEFHSLDLETIINVELTHKCELGYYPEGQCHKFCFPKTGEHKCDDFGNMICEKGLFYDAKKERCVANNCAKSNVQCRNSGTCVNEGNGVKCICRLGFLGEFCERIDNCYPNPCKNGGQCQIPTYSEQMITRYRCICKTGFIGNLCDRPISSKSPPLLPPPPHQPLFPINTPVSNSHCPCPSNMNCKYTWDKNGERIVSCIGKETNEYQQSNAVVKKVKNINDDEQFEKKITLTTIIVVGIGCIIFLLCITVTLMVCYQTRSTIRKHQTSSGNNGLNYPSTQYSHFSPQTFKRAASLDENSTYLFSPHYPTTHSALNTLPHPIPMTPSTQSNSYQETPYPQLLYSQQLINPSDSLPIQQPQTQPQLPQPSSSPTRHSRIMNHSLLGTNSTFSVDSDAPSLPPRPATLD